MFYIECVLYSVGVVPLVAQDFHSQKSVFVGEFAHGISAPWDTFSKVSALVYFLRTATRETAFLRMCAWALTFLSFFFFLFLWEFVPEASTLACTRFALSTVFYIECVLYRMCACVGVQYRNHSIENTFYRENFLYRTNSTWGVDVGVQDLQLPKNSQKSVSEYFYFLFFIFYFYFYFYLKFSKVSARVSLLYKVHISRIFWGFCFSKGSALACLLCTCKVPISRTFERKKKSL